MESVDDKLLQKAEYLSELERWQEAVSLLLKVIAKNPADYDANCLLSFCQYNLKDFEAALGFAEKAIAAEPEEECGHRLRSVALTETGRKKEALKSAEEAARLAPFEPLALQTLVYAYLQCGRSKQANEIALKMRENFPETEAAFFTLGIVHLRNRNYHEAERCFREALRINPNSSDARNNLGVSLLRQTQSDNTSLFKTSGEEEIQRHFTEAIKLRPNNETAAENLKNQFSYSNVLYGFLVLIPFLSIAFFIAPGMIILTFLVAIYLILKMLLVVWRRRKQLTPELLMFLQSSANKTLFFRFEEFSDFAANIYGKTWKPHTLAVFALILCYANFEAAPKYGSNNLSRALAFILVTFSGFWMQSELSKD